MDNQERARQILRRVWIGEAWLTESESNFLTEHETRGEMQIDTCLRLAGVVCDWRSLPMPKRAAAIKKALTGK